MAKFKLLHIITCLHKGGSSENTFLSCIGLDKGKFEVNLLAGETIDTYQNLIKEAGDSGVQFIFLPELVRNIKPFKDIKAFFKIYALIKREKFDIIHTHSSKAGFIGRLAAKLAGVPVIIYTPHGHIFYGYFNWFLTKVFISMEKLVAICTDKIITLTEAGKDEWVKFGIASRDKFIAIHSGIRLKSCQESIVMRMSKKEELGIPLNAKIVGAVGRLVLIKGHKYLIEAMPEIIKEYPEVLFLLIGEGPLKVDLTKQSQVLGIEEKIKFLGWREDLSQILPVMDVFVLPSLNEGMGRVLVEAMAAGLPVIASDVGGIPSVVINGKTGRLVTPARPAALAQAIIKLLRNTERAKIMGEEGRKIARANFNAEEMVKQIEELYQDLLKKVSR